MKHTWQHLYASKCCCCRCCCCCFRSFQFKRQLKSYLNLYTVFWFFGELAVGKKSWSRSYDNFSKYFLFICKQWLLTSKEIDNDHNCYQCKYLYASRFKQSPIELLSWLSVISSSMVPPFPCWWWKESRHSIMFSPAVLPFTILHAFYHPICAKPNICIVF